MSLPNFKIPLTLFNLKLIKVDFMDPKYTKFTNARDVDRMNSYWDAAECKTPWLFYGSYWAYSGATGERSWCHEWSILWGLVISPVLVIWAVVLMSHSGHTDSPTLLGPALNEEKEVKKTPISAQGFQSVLFFFSRSSKASWQGQTRKCASLAEPLKTAGGFKDLRRFLFPCFIVPSD